MDNGFDGHLYLNGLASHFRDLLVCKDPRTIDLLEVGETTKERYKQQSQKTEMGFLLKGLKILSDADVRFKSTNNPRLLVELCLLQLTELLFSTEKKNSSQALEQGISQANVPKSNAREISIPQASYGKQLSAKPKVEPIPSKSSGADKQKESSSAPRPPTIKVAAEAVPSYSGRMKKPKSGFSISRVLNGEELNKKKNEEEEIDETAINPELPKDEISKNRLENLWRDYMEDLKKQQKHLTYNSLAKAGLKLEEDFSIVIELHSKAQVSNFEAEKRDLLKYLREKLNNFSIQFRVEMTKTAAKLEPYTAQEKYEYMAKKNPYLHELRKKLNLDLE